jgi:hypothetical protein
MKKQRTIYCTPKFANLWWYIEKHLKRGESMSNLIYRVLLDFAIKNYDYIEPENLGE